MKKKNRMNKKYYSKEQKPFINKSNNNKRKSKLKISKSHTFLLIKKPSLSSLIKILKFFFIFFNCFILFDNYIPKNKILKNNGYINENINNYNNNEEKTLEIDNKINISYYENDIDFSKYSTNIKAIALYMPDFYQIKSNNFNSLDFLKKVKPIYKDHHQPRIPGDENYLKYYDLSNHKVIQKQINLAKRHGIYGFAIYFYWFSGKTIFDKPLNIIYKNNIEFHYLLIWKNENIYNWNNELLLEEKYEENDPVLFIKDIKKYLIDKKYIKIDGKPIIGIYNPISFPKLQILTWREKAREFGIGEIFVISTSNNYLKPELNGQKLFDAAYESPPNDLIENNFLRNKDNYFFHYTGLIYKSLSFKYENNNLTVYRSSMLEWDNSLISNKSTIFEDYSPELFYLINKIIINWTLKENNESNNLIFINAWNNYFEGTYLEPDEKYGYSSINALSKALFDLPYKKMIYNISYFMNKTYIAVQAHVFYQEIINEIINKTNNIPLYFDLYITTDSNQKMEYIQKNIEKFSKSNKYYIQLVQNKGRDLLPFLNQMGEVYNKYKYICHIHSKKLLHLHPNYGVDFRTFLFLNLLGNSEIISECLTDFENNEKLGLIFPDICVGNIEHSMNIENVLRNNMIYILNKIFPGHRIGNKLEFPMSNMFWARIESIYQIFKIDYSKIFKDDSQLLLYAFERIWLYIVKLNGYSYKKIIKYY